jgi:hypothetical protein
VWIDAGLEQDNQIDLVARDLMSDIANYRGCGDDSRFVGYRAAVGTRADKDQTRG